MAVQEISRQEWMAFAKRFTKEHQGQPVTIQVTLPNQSRKEVAREVPFQELTAELDKDGMDSLVVFVGNPNDPQLDHTVSKVRLVRLRDGNGDGPRLEILSGNGESTELYWRGPEAEPKGMQTATG